MQRLLPRGIRNRYRCEQTTVITPPCSTRSLLGDGVIASCIDFCVFALLDRSSADELNAHCQRNKSRYTTPPYCTEETNRLIFEPISNQRLKKFLCYITNSAKAIITEHAINQGHHATIIVCKNTCPYLASEIFAKVAI